MAVSVAVCEIFSVKEWRDLESRVRVRSRSLEMAPFDRSHTSSYSPSIVSMAISSIFCEMSWLIGRKSRNFHTPPGTCDPVGISWRRLMVIKTEWLGYHAWWKNYDDMLSRFHLIPERYGQTDGRTDRRTNRQTDRFAISISRVSMLTCDKNPYLFQLPMHRLATWLLHFVPTPYPGSHETAGSNAEQNFYDSKTRLGSLLYPNVQLYSPNGSITHSLVDLPRWVLMTAGDHSDIFLLHCARSCDITFSWMYSQPVHSSIYTSLFTIKVVVQLI